MPDFLAEELQDFINRQYMLDPKRRLFPYTKSFLSHEMLRGCKDSGVKKIRIHDLRHSHASLLINQGFDALTIAERLGHEKVSTTWINENNLEQHLIVTYSIKYRNYQRTIRERQIERAKKFVESPSKLTKNRANDPKRFIEQGHCTPDGEIASKTITSLNQNQIDNEAKYDGLYAVCTNLEYDVSSIIKINQKRWEIEECFRIMKTEFKARPVYLSRKDRITAHFTTCFTALVIYRILEQKLNEKYTCEELIDTIRSMDMLIAPGEGYIPTYTRTDITDALHDAFGFRTDYQITSQKNMRKILNQTKKK